MSKARSLTLTAYADPSHAWLKVPCSLLEELKIVDAITDCSMLNGAYAYLEEDHDATVFGKAAEAAGYVITLKEEHTDRRSRVREYRSYTPADCRERLARLAPAAGLIAEYGGERYTLKRNLGRKGWEVERSDGVTFRLKARQLSQARLVKP